MSVTFRLNVYQKVHQENDGVNSYVDHFDMLSTAKCASQDHKILKSYIMSFPVSQTEIQFTYQRLDDRAEDQKLSHTNVEK